MSKLSIAHFGLRTRDLPEAVHWYQTALGARVRFSNEIAAFMSFDEEHHRFVIWNDGATETKPENASGVDHIGFACGSLADLADEYERLKAVGIEPTLTVNHGFTCSIYYYDPDGNDVELTADNFPTKEKCAAFMGSEAMILAMEPPLFGSRFDPEDLLNMRRTGANEAAMARVGIT